MTDRAFLLAVLADGHEHELSEIIGRSQAQRGFGLTVHSRAAELRPILAAEGKTIVQRSDRSNGRVRSYYKLVDTPHREGDAGQSSPVSGGWVSAEAPGATAAGDHDLNVVPMDSTGDASITAASTMEQDGGGIPGSAPTAAPTLFDVPTPRERFAA